MEEEKKIVGDESETEAAQEVEATETTAEPEAKAETTAPAEKKIDEDTLVKKIIYCLCYIWGILFFVPLIAYKDDEEAKIHANHGLALLLLAIGGNVLFGLLTMIAALHVVFSVIAAVYSLALLVLGIMGIINVVTGNVKKLPIISSFKLIK